MIVSEPLGGGMAPLAPPGSASDQQKCTNKRTRLANQVGGKPWEDARLLRTNGEVGREAVVYFQTKFANLM